MHLTLQQLRYLVAAADAGSLALAAQRLNVASTAVSLQIKAIEDEYGTPLLHRHSRGVRATAAGADLVARARDVLTRVAEAESALRRPLAAMPRQLRLGLPPAIARLIGTELMSGGADRFAGIAIEIETGWSHDLEDRLRRGDLDAVVGFGLQGGDGVHVVPLSDVALVFVAAPSVAGGCDPIPLAEALRADLVFYGRNSVGWRASVAAAAAAGLAPPGARHVTSIDVWRQILVRGLGTTITAMAAVEQEWLRGEIVARPILGEPIRLFLSVAFPEGSAASFWASQFCDFVEEIVQTADARIVGPPPPDGAPPPAREAPPPPIGTTV